MSDKQNDPPQIMGALPSPESASNTATPHQPRQPANLQGLLRFCMEATQGEDAPAASSHLPMDEERKRFLERTLKSLTVDVIEVILTAIETLKMVGDLGPDADARAHEEALDNITDLVSNMDTANDFFKIGGFSILRPCLMSSHSSVRWRAANLIAELTQNNPFCQRAILNENLMPLLLHLLDTDSNDQVQIKALYALSCLVRDSKDALTQFLSYDGFSVLLRAMESNVEKLKIKTSFLVSALCTQQPSIKDQLCEMGFVEQLVALIQREDARSHEQLMAALTSLVTEHKPSQRECRRPELQLENTLKLRMESVEGKEEYREQYEYCEGLMKTLFQAEDTEER